MLFPYSAFIALLLSIITALPPSLSRSAQQRTALPHRVQVLNPESSRDVCGRPRPKIIKRPHAGSTSSPKASDANVRSSPAPSGASTKSSSGSEPIWHGPQVLEDGRQILPFNQTRQPASPIPNKGWNRAGQTITSPDGKTSIRFDKHGFPEFNSQFETKLGEHHIGSGNPKAHFRAANESLYKDL